MKINLSQLPNKFANHKLELTRKVRRVLVREGGKFDELNIVFLNDHGMQSLNKKFLKRNYVTDVLAFLLDERYGEIYIGADQLTDDRHLDELVLHGLFHLLGYDHKKIKNKRLMENKISFYLSRSTPK